MNNETKYTENLSDIFKSWFTEEELKLLEEKYNTLKEEKEKGEEPMFGNH